LLVLRQDLVQLIHGDKAFGLGVLEELFDFRVAEVEDRAVFFVGEGIICFGFRHVSTPVRWAFPSQHTISVPLKEDQS